MKHLVAQNKENIALKSKQKQRIWVIFILFFLTKRLSGYHTFIHKIDGEYRVKPEQKWTGNI